MPSVCNVAETSAFLKQFTIVLVNTWAQALVSMYMASRMLNLRMILLLSKATMTRRNAISKYGAYCCAYCFYFLVTDFCIQDSAEYQTITVRFTQLTIERIYNVIVT